MLKNYRFLNIQYRLVFLLPVCIISFLTSCQKPSITFSNSFIGSNNTSIVVTDTPTVTLSTVALDSFITAGTGSMLLGRYHDPFLGTITSKTFFQLGNPGTPSVSVQAGFDSIAIIMYVNKSFYADTTITQRYYVSQLDQVIQYPSATQRTFYNNSSIPYNPDPLGFTDVRISPTRGLTSQNALDTVKIRLPDSLGLRLLTMIQNKSDTVSNFNSFLGYFKGLVIYSDTNSQYTGTMFGFKDTVIMRLYYHEPGVVTNPKFIDFPYDNASYQFNNITVDRTGTPLEILSSLQSSRPNPLIPAEAPSSSTNFQVFVNGSTGIQTKIRFPNISNILSIPDYINVYKAQLILRPIVGTFSPELPLPPQLILVTTNETNLLGSTIFYNGAVEYGNLNVDYVYGENTTYSYDITNYIKQQLAIGGDNKNGLMLMLPANSAKTIFNRAVLGDNTNKIYNIKLKLYYVSLVH